MVEESLNPLAIRQAAEVSVKETSTNSLFSQRLAQSIPPESILKSEPSLSTLSESLSPTQISQMVDMPPNRVSQMIKNDLGSTLKEVLSNATQTGAEEQLDNIPLEEVGKALLDADGSLSSAVRAIENLK